jgi:hypothetical protein
MVKNDFVSCCLYAGKMSGARPVRDKRWDLGAVIGSNDRLVC